MWCQKWLQPCRKGEALGWVSWLRWAAQGSQPRTGMQILSSPLLPWCSQGFFLSLHVLSDTTFNIIYREKCSPVRVTQTPGSAPCAPSLGSEPDSFHLLLGLEPWFMCKIPLLEGIYLNSQELQDPHSSHHTMITRCSVVFYLFS